MKVIRTIDAPEHVSSWPHHWVQAKYSIANAYGVAPAGTLMQLGTCSVNKYLTSEGCSCCGVKFKVVFKGSKSAFLSTFDFVEVVDD